MKMINDDDTFWWWIGGILIFISAMAALIFVMVANPRAAKARDIKGEFAQYTPEEKQWLQRQVVPGKRSSCCSEADGTKAQEEIRGNQYWISFEACYAPGNYVPPLCSIKGPMPVPDEAVLRVPNEVGRPIVWYGWASWDSKKNDGVAWIRCFIPGAKF